LARFVQLLLALLAVVMMVPVEMEGQVREALLTSSGKAAETVGTMDNLAEVQY
jgi:hypothetical protein